MSLRFTSVKDAISSDDNEPTTISSIPDNPAFIFQMFSPEHQDKGENTAL